MWQRLKQLKLAAAVATYREGGYAPIQALAAARSGRIPCNLSLQAIRTPTHSFRSIDCLQSSKNFYSGRCIKIIVYHY